MKLMADMSLLNKFNHFSTQTQRQFITFFIKSTNNCLGISQEFLQDDPSEWKCDTELSEYKGSQRLIQSLRVVNNLAESDVALTYEFNSSLKGDEEQKQYLLQVIEDDGKQFSASTN